MIGKRVKLDWSTLAALMLALPLIAPFLASGLPNSADGEIHLHRIVSAAVNLDAGYLWPRWTPYLHQGYGYAIHNFYAPGIHIVGGALYLLTRLDPVAILKLLQVVATLLYPLGAYRFARAFTGKTGALVAAAAYTYAPFRFHELWVQTNLSQFWAMALLPWLFAAIARAAQQPRRGGVALIGGLFGAIILLHHPTGFLIAPFAGIYVLWLSGRDWRKIVVLSVGLALGLLLSAVFWVPALAELQFTQISRVQEGAFDVIGNLIDLPQLIRLVAPVDRSLLNSPSFYSVGMPQFLVGLFAAFSAVPLKAMKPMLRRNVIFGGLGLTLSLWLMTPSSGWVWLHLPIARLVIYPWRLLGVAALMALPGAAVLPSLVPVRWRAALAGGLIGVFLTAALPMLYAPLSFDAVPPATPETAILYEQRTGNVGLTSADEYLPVGVIERPLSVSANEFASFEWRVDLETLPDGVSAERMTCGRGETCYRVDAPAAFTLVFHQMAFPGLGVTVDGAAVETAPSGAGGLLSAAIPAGAHMVSVRYAGTPIQHASEAISLIALVISAILLVTAKWTRQVTDDEPQANALARRVVVVIGGFVLINGLYLTPQTSIFRPASDPTAPPAQHRLSVDFGALELVGYEITPESARPGETIRVRLYWRARQALDSVPRGAVHVTAMDGRADWGGSESLALGAMPAERWTVGGYVTDDYRFTLAPDAPPFVGEVRVTLLGTGKKTVKIGELRVEGDWRIFEDQALPFEGARFGDQIALIGAGVRHSDGETCLDLRWSARFEGQIDYTIMLHLLDAAGRVVAYGDAPPLDGLYPTSRWIAGQTLDDRHCFNAGEAVALRLGLYNPADGARLPVTSAQGYTVEENSLHISLK